MLGLEIFLLPTIWEGGCTVTYHIDSTALEYARAIPHEAARITEKTGIRFLPSLGPADITFMQHRKNIIPYHGLDGVIGLWSAETKTIWLTPVAPMLRRGLVLHEMIHALGAAHSPQNEAVMNGQGYHRLDFTQDDLDTLNYIAGRNGCQG